MTTPKKTTAPKKEPKDPVEYSDELIAVICAEMAAGRSLTSVLRDDPGMPTVKTFMRWLMGVAITKEQSIHVGQQYDRARDARTDFHAEQILDIGDTPLMGEEHEIDAEGGVKTKRSDAIRHRQLQIDTRKWVMARMSPKKYGDRQTVDLGNKDNKPFKTEDKGKSAADLALDVVNQLRGQRAAEDKGTK